MIEYSHLIDESTKNKKVKQLSPCTQLSAIHLASKGMLFLLLHNTSRLSVIRWETLNIYIVKRGFITDV